MCRDSRTSSGDAAKDERSKSMAAGARLGNYLGHGAVDRFVFRDQVVSESRVADERRDNGGGGGDRPSTISPLISAPKPWKGIVLLTTPHRSCACLTRGGTVPKSKRRHMPARRHRNPSVLSYRNCHTWNVTMEGDFYGDFAEKNSRCMRRKAWPKSYARPATALKLSWRQAETKPD